MAVIDTEATRPRLLRSASFGGFEHARTARNYSRDLRPAALQQLQLFPEPHRMRPRLVAAWPTLPAPRAQTYPHAQQIARGLHDTGLQIDFAAGLAPGSSRQPAHQSTLGECCSQIWPATSRAPILLFDLPNRAVHRRPGRQPLRHLAHILYGTYTLVAVAESYRRFAAAGAAAHSAHAADCLEPYRSELSAALWRDICAGILAGSRYTPMQVIETEQQIHVIRPLAQASLSELSEWQSLAMMPPYHRNIVGDRLLASICPRLEQLHQAGLCHQDVRPQNILLDTAPQLLRSGPSDLPWGAAVTLHFDLVKFHKAGLGHASSSVEGELAWASPQALACDLGQGDGVFHGPSDDWFRLARSVLFATKDFSLPGPGAIEQSVPLAFPAALLAAKTAGEAASDEEISLPDQLRCWQYGLSLALLSTSTSRGRGEPLGSFSLLQQNQQPQAAQRKMVSHLAEQPTELKQLSQRLYVEFRRQLFYSNEQPYAQLLALSLDSGHGEANAQQHAQQRALLWPKCQQPRIDRQAPADLRSTQAYRALRDEDDACLFLTSAADLSPWYLLYLAQQAYGRFGCERDLYPALRASIF